MCALIAFDLDGVIYTAEPFLGEAYREAIAAVHLQRPGAFARVPSTREILDHVGWPLPVILERLFSQVDPVALELLYTETLPVICRRVARREGRLFPRVVATLATLRESGFLLAIASNGRHQYVEAVLAAHDIGHYFTDVVSVDRDGPLRHKADVLRTYAARHRIAPAELFMVGDRVSDVEAAAAVGCRFIGCDYGHGYRSEIEGAGPVVSAFEQLPNAIATLLTMPVLPNGDGRR
jgi:phosphoglycolate phosphatase